MKRTTIMVDDAVLEELRAIARAEGVSLAEVIRQALELRLRQRPARPSFIAAWTSEPGHPTARESAEARPEPRPWR